ncbi:MAG: hypothetical protein Q9222_001027 [Ikaeria aurantiellina]
MALLSSQQFRGLSRVDLRLVYHLLSIYQDMENANLSQCSVWVEELPSFLNAAHGYDFVMSGILAFAATHLAWLTSSVGTKNLAYYHRGVALKGLHDAIGHFSQESSDAILAASILLSWQTSDWSGWTSLMQGISTILSSMSRWRETSLFASFIDAQIDYFTAPLVQPQPFSDDQALLAAISGLHRISARIPGDPTVSSSLTELSDFAQSIHSSSATMRSEQIFTKLQPLRAWLFWRPLTLLGDRVAHATDLVVLAQLYTVALAVDISLPELRGAALGSLTARPVDCIDQRLRYDFSSLPRATLNISPAMFEEALLLPRSLVTKYRTGGITVPVHSPGQGQGHQSPYGMQHLNLSSTPGTPGFPPGTPLSLPIGFGSGFPTVLNPSVEDLSVPPSPFLNYGGPSSRRHSQLVEISPGLYEEGSFDARSATSHSFRGDSPAYSSSFHDDDYGAAFRSRSPSSYPKESVAPILWA